MKRFVVQRSYNHVRYSKQTLLFHMIGFLSKTTLLIKKFHLIVGGLCVDSCTVFSSYNIGSTKKTYYLY